MVKVAVLGYGTVGSGIVEVIKTNQDMVNKKAGDEIDVVAPAAGYVLPVVFALAVVIYIVFWFENKLLLNVVLLSASAVMVMMLPDNIIFEGQLPVWADKIVAAAFIFIFVNGAKNINLLAGG